VLSQCLGVKRTSVSRLAMSAFGGIADIAIWSRHFRGQVCRQDYANPLKTEAPPCHFAGVVSRQTSSANVRAARGGFLFCKHFQRQSIAEKNNSKVAGVRSRNHKVRSRLSGRARIDRTKHILGRWCARADAPICARRLNSSGPRVPRCPDFIRAKEVRRRFRRGRSGLGEQF
jgi:hypothetical protein